MTISPGDAPAVRSDPAVSPAGPTQGCETGPDLAPVFLQAGFRTCSTWLWQKLRGAPTTMAFYEIYNVALASLSPTRVRSCNASIWDSRHPSATPYFLEFLPLLDPGGGVCDFNESGLFGTFMSAGRLDGDLDPAETPFVERLIAHARSRQRIPVLSCTGSLGRTRPLHRAFGGRTILLHRNLFHQWASFGWQVETGNNHFTNTLQTTVQAGRHDPFLTNLATWFDLPNAAPSPEDLFEIFVILHLYLYGLAFDVADVVVDTTEIASNRTERRRVERAISDLIRHDIDLSDAQANCEYTSFAAACPAKIRDTIEQFAKLIPRDQMSVAAGLFIEDMKDRALSEWDRFEFFNRRTRSVLTAKLQAAEADLQNRVAEVDRLGRLLAEASHVHDAFRAAQDGAIQTLTAERDQLAQTSADASSAHDVHLAAKNETIRSLTSERDRLARQLAESTAAQQRDVTAGTGSSDGPDAPVASLRAVS